MDILLNFPKISICNTMCVFCVFRCQQASHFSQGTHVLLQKLLYCLLFIQFFSPPLLYSFLLFCFSAFLLLCFFVFFPFLSCPFFLKGFSALLRSCLFVFSSQFYFVYVRLSHIFFAFLLSSLCFCFLTSTTAIRTTRTATTRSTAEKKNKDNKQKQQE